MCISRNGGIKDIKKFLQQRDPDMVNAKVTFILFLISC